jgi:hypothetical protein
VSKTAPLWREASFRIPGFAKQSDKAVVFLWSRDQRNMKVGDVSDILEDTIDRRWLMAVCEAVEPLTVADVPHKEYEQQRTNYKGAGISFAESQVRKALAQSFSRDALKARYDFNEDKPQQEN